MDRFKQLPSDASGLWAVCWRMFVFGPVFAILGISLLTVVLALTLMPLYAIGLAVVGEYVWAALCAAAWLAWLKFGAPMRRFVLEGFEHGSL